MALIPFCRSSNRITCILVRQNIKTVARLYLKIKELMNPVKDSLGLHIPGVYQIPWTRGNVHVGHTGCACRPSGNRSTNVVFVEAILIRQLLPTSHKICFEKTTVLHKSVSWQERITRVSIELCLRKGNTLIKSRGKSLLK